MDHRDEINLHGTYLNSLPELHVDTNTMTATFCVDPEGPDPVPPPPPSKLEVLGAKIDDKLCTLVSRFTKKLYAKGALNDAYQPYKFSEFFPKRFLDRNAPVRESAESVRESLRRSWQERSIHRLVRVHVTIIQKGNKYWPPEEVGQPLPNNVQLDFVFGERTRWIPGFNFWIAFAGRPATSDGGSYTWREVVPFQVGTGMAPCPRY